MQSESKPVASDVSAKPKRSAASLNLPEGHFNFFEVSANLWALGSPLILLTVEGPRYPLAGDSLLDL